MGWLDTKKHEREERNFDPIPPGWYAAELNRVEDTAATKSGGARVPCSFQITDAEYAGRLVFHGFNVENKNPEAVRISQDQIADIADALGVHLQINSVDDVPQALNQLMDQTLEIKVRIEKDKSGQYEPQNKAIAFRAYEGDKPSKSSGAGTKQRTMEAMSRGAKSGGWRKR